MLCVSLSMLTKKCTYSKTAKFLRTIDILQLFLVPEWPLSHGPFGLRPPGLLTQSNEGERNNCP